ncbi:MAG TPA: hypothetical protein VNE58_02010 [Casimicrobiaceae bacterium]|nr:hypothetical protein [Casimicrobiaceae bacterium]
MRSVTLAAVAALAATIALPASAQSYLTKPRVVGGNPGPAHNYVCPNVDKGGALDCYLDAVRHLYTMCRHVKSLEILEYGYERADEGTNMAKSESCIDKQKNNIARPYQTAMRELAGSKAASASLRELHESWLASLAALKWRPGETDEDYKVRTGFTYVDFDERSDAIRTSVADLREQASAKKSGTRRDKAAR